MRFNAGGANPGYALGTSEPRVQEFFATALRPGMVFWDVGANVGFFTVLAARLVGPDGHVVAIEPMPENLRALRHNVALNNLTNVIVVPCAAAARREQLRMLRGHEPTWSRVACNGEGDAGEPVQGEPLDALPARFGVAPPDVVKLDVEGAECDALAGMAELLGEKRPVIVAEMHGRSAEFARVLRAHGYVLRALESALPVEEAPWWVHVVATPTGALGASAGAG
jgi:FkbM family methyltransferase